MIGEKTTLNGKPVHVIYRNWRKIAYFEDGILHWRYLDPDADRLSRSAPGPCYDGPLPEMAKELGLDYSQDRHVESLLDACAGKGMAFLKAELERRKAHSDKAKACRKENAAAWEALRKKFSNAVIGVDDFDIYGQGFTIYVMISALMPFHEQSEWLKANRRDLVAYVQHELPCSGGLAKRRRRQALDLLPLCRLSEIVLSRTNHVLLKYDLKDEAIEAIEALEK